MSETIVKLANQSIQDTEEAVEATESSQNERSIIRQKLSELSFEEILELKAKMGTKLLTETMFGEKNRKKKRSGRGQPGPGDKDAPLEISSKRPRRIRSIEHQRRLPTLPTRSQPRDPRFDALCGTFEKDRFARNYQFIEKIKDNEYDTLKNELTTTKDPMRVQTIKTLMQRLSNQKREREKRERIQKESDAKRQENIERLKSGRRPVFQRKSEQKLERIIGNYAELKGKNRANKYIEKTRAKHAKKSLRQHLEPIEHQ